MRRFFSFVADYGYKVSLVLVVFTLPFSIRLNSYAIVLLALSFLLEGNWNAKWRSLIGNKFAVLLIGFFLFNAFGLLYTLNIKQGLFELEKKISFLIFPIVIAASSQIDSKLLINTLRYFVIACLIASLICVVNASYQAYNSDFSYFYYHKLGSPISIHAVYFSLYIGVCVITLQWNLLTEWSTLKPRSRITRLIGVIYFIVFLILLSSKTILVAVFLILMYVFLKYIFKIFKPRIGVAILVLLVGLFVLPIILIPNVNGRFVEMIDDKMNQRNPLFLDDYRDYHFTGGAIRLAIWKMTIEILREENAWLFGVGTGDSQDLLTAKYISKNVYPGDETHEGFMHYNTHNEFFQVLLTTGIIGLIWFVMILVMLFKTAVNSHEYLVLLILLIFVSFCFTESTLSAQKGIVFFSLLTSLYMATSRRHVIVS